MKPLPKSGAARGAYRANNFEEPEGSALDLGELAAVLRRQLWLILLLGAVGLGGTYFLLSLEQPRYRASALIRLRDAQAEVAGAVLQQAGGSGGPKGDPLTSELMVLRGRQVAGAVVDRQGLRIFDREAAGPAAMLRDVLVTVPAAESREIALTFGASDVTVSAGRERLRAAYGQPIPLTGVRFTVPERPAGLDDASLVVVPRDGAVDWMIAGLTARQPDGTDAIMVSVVSPGPELSVRTANAVVDEYQSANTARSRELNRRRRTFLEARLRESDDSLVAAQTTLGSFRNRSGGYSSREQSQVSRAGANDAEVQRKQLAAEQRIRHAQLDELAQPESPGRTAALRSLLASPDIAANPIVAQLFARVTQLETRRDELRAAGRPRTHEDVQQIQNMITASEAQLVEAIGTQVAVLDARLNALGTVRQQATDELSRLTPAEAQEVRFAEQVEAMRVVSNQLRAELQRVRLAEAVEMGQVEVIDPATRAVPLATKRGLKLVLGLAFGLFLGAALAFIREHLNTSINRRVDLERLLHLPGLAVIPQLQPAGKRHGLFGGSKKATRPPAGGANHRRTSPATGVPVVLPELVTVANVHDSAAEAYRALRTRLLFANSGSVLRSMLITSASVGEGKTTTAANLAVTMAQQGLRVLLVDCDLRRPRLHSMFGVTNDAGLSDVLNGRASTDDLVRATGVERLSLLTSGPPRSGGAGPSELLGGMQMGAFLASAGEEFDLVLLDTPPVLAAPDAAALAARVGATVLVVRAGTTSRAMAQDAVQQLGAVGANVIGAVLNDPDAKTSEYREQSYQHGYYANA